VIPVLTDKIQVDGQQLVRARRVSDAELVEEAATNRGSAPPMEASDTGINSPVRSLEEVARKHLGNRAEEVLEDHGEFLKALVEEEEPSSAVIDHARRLEVFSDTAPAIPHPESNPDKRADGSVSPLVVSGDAPDFMADLGHPETLLDLFHAFPQLDGLNWFIHVERKQPRIYSGTRCDGTLQPIGRPLDLAEWQTWYGGGEYKLIVYGPPKNGSVVNSDGRVSPRKLTEPITVKFPGPPSFESMVYDFGAGDRDPMTQQADVFPPRRGPMTTADASVASKQIDVAADREKRLEAEAKEARSAREAKEREANAGNSGLIAELLKSQREAQAREAELRERAVEREREFAREQREFEARMDAKFQSLLGDKKPDDVERLVKLSTTLNGGGSSLEAMRAEHAREIERLQDLRTQMEANHARAIVDERARGDGLVRDASERADRRIRDAEERSASAEREARARADAEVQRTKEECERRLADEHRRNTDRIADMDRMHQRDLQTMKDSHARDLASLEATWTMRVDSAKSEIKRAQTDAERARAEAEANKDVAGQITKAKEFAGLLGMVEASESGGGEAEPKTVPQLLVEAGTGLLSNAPAMIENIAAMMRGKDQQQLELARQQGRQEIIQQSQQQVRQLPGAHPARGSARQEPPFRPLSAGRPVPLVPGQPQPRRQQQPDLRPIAPGEALQPEEVIARELEQRRQAELAAEQAKQPPAPPAPPPMSYAPPPMPTEQFQEPQHAAPFVPGSEPVPSGPSAGAVNLSLVEQEDIQIMGAEALLLGHYQQKTSPLQLAAVLYQTHPEDSRQLLAQLGSSDRVAQAFLRRGGPNHPLARRDGKKFLAELFNELKKLVG
jgi:hypothetical protein